jgi:hypothetical protein
MNKFMRAYTLILFPLVFLLAISACAQEVDEEREWVPEDTEFYEPVPTVIEAQPAFIEPPSDATILFDGTDFSNWKMLNGDEDVEWTIEDGVMTVTPGSGDIVTRDNFGSVQLYVEWRAPAEIEGDGQGRGNSGVFLQRRYEVQVLDSYENETYVNGMAGSIYKQYVPLANPASPPGEWNTYNIIYEAPEFNENHELVTPAYFTVIWNGVLVQNRVEVKGNTVYIGLPEYSAHGDDGIRLQDHGDLVSFRNIWVRELDESPVWEDNLPWPEY